MYPIAEEMKALFNQKQRQTVNITVELKEGSAADDFSITEADIISNSFSVDRYCATGESIEIGSAVAAELRFTLDNSSGKFDGISLGGAKLFVRLGIKDWNNADAHMNYMDLSYFTIDENPKPLTQISVAALDNMMRFDRAVNWNNFNFPMNIADIVSVSCADCDVTISPFVVFVDLPNGSYTVQNKPSTADITYRQLIQWVAEITGTCAFIDWNGHLRFKWSESTTVEINTSNRYSSTTDESITITGVQITESEDNIYLYGEEGFVFNIEGNELIQNNQTEIVSNLGAVLCGFTYVPFECNCFPMPYLYPLDIISFSDIKGNTFDTMITAHVYTLNGTSSLKGAGENQQQKNYSVSSPFTKREAIIIKNLKKQAEKKMNRIEQETVDMNKALSNALGLYDTTVKHDDGSITYYYHSKPTLEECAEGDVIFCLNAGGFGVCTSGWNNGEPVFDYGVDAKSGKAIWTYLTVTHKLSASLIEAGILQSTDGSVCFDLDKAIISLLKKDSSGNTLLDVNISPQGIIGEAKKTITFDEVTLTSDEIAELEAEYGSNTTVLALMKLAKRVLKYQSMTMYGVVLTSNDANYSYRNHMSGNASVMSKFSGDSLVSESEYRADGMKVSGLVEGDVLGLGALANVASNTDMNDLLTPGAFSIRTNAIAETIINLPLPVAGRVFVAGATGTAVASSGSAYWRQTFIPYQLKYPIFEREITRNSSNTWNIGSWIPTSLNGQKILWSGYSQMGNGVTINLTEKISQQPNGITLVFSYVQDNGAVADYYYSHHCIDKAFVSVKNGASSQFFMNMYNFALVGSKLLYIYDDKIIGYTGNTNKGTAQSGITYDNSRWMLRYILAR